MRIYVICPVRNISEDQKQTITIFVNRMERIGNQVYYPPRDAPQESKTGYEIVMSELEAIKACDHVVVFWDINSKGSHFDLGMAVALGKKISMEFLFEPDGKEKSYVKVIREINDRKSVS
jgi:nucleoside 2-deoxyribosyltransferase